MDDASQPSDIGKNPVKGLDKNSKTLVTNVEPRILVGGQPPLVLTAPPPLSQPATRPKATLAFIERANKPPAKQELGLKHGMWAVCTHEILY